MSIGVWRVLLLDDGSPESRAKALAKVCDPDFGEYQSKVTLHAKTCVNRGGVEPCNCKPLTRYYERRTGDPVYFKFESEVWE